MTNPQDPKSPQQPPTPDAASGTPAATPRTEPGTTSASGTATAATPALGADKTPHEAGHPVAGTAEASSDMPGNPDSLTRPIPQHEANASAPDATGTVSAASPHGVNAGADATGTVRDPSAPAPVQSPATLSRPAPHTEVANDRNPIGAAAPATRDEVKAAGVGSAGGAIDDGAPVTAGATTGNSPPGGGGEPPHQPTFSLPPGGGRPGGPQSMGTQPSYLQAGDSPWSVLRRIMGARFRAWYDRAGQRITQRTLKIGISARIFHPEPGSKGLRGKTLQYLEESIAHWVMSRDVLVFMIPTVDTQGQLHPSHIRLHDYAKHLDGLVLQGGADVSPMTYSEVATRHEWQGDRMRDMYELELLHEFVDAGKPVLGVCRGCQLINVAFGGTLHQDIATDLPETIAHVTDTYEHNRHTLQFPDGSSLAQMLGPVDIPIVNSIHHQSVKTLGRDLSVEAVCAEDGVVEAIRYRKAPFVMGLQWHPEFHRAGGPEFLDCTPVLDNFLRAARETRF